MITGRVRSALLGSAVGVGLVAASTTANALEYNFGGVQVFFDTTVSAGVQMRVAERNLNFVAAGNGGPTADLNVIRPGGADGAVTTAISAANNLTLNTTTDSFAGSISSDDSRLNFDQWDLTSANVKMTNDIQANWENYKFFARVSSFYDAVLGQESSYERSALRREGYPDAVRDIDLLDFYVSGDFNVGDLPLNIRLGKQVVNWGEATFILNGISSWNPFDVNAFRRPGAEIREGLLPVWGAYASLGLPYDLSAEFFYQLDFEPLQLDRPGTPFSGSDIARVGSGTGGNEDGLTWLTGGRSGGGFLNRNCSTPNALSTAFDAAYTAAAAGTPSLNNFICGGTNAFIDYATDLPVGQSEFYRLLLRGGTADVGRLADKEADDQGQYGMALRWYSEDLNSTEFGFYFMNYHSRLPMVSEKLILRGAANSEVRVYTGVEDNSGATTRGTLGAGCFAPVGISPLLPAASTPGVLTAGLDTAKLLFLNANTVNDPHGLSAAAELVVSGGVSTHLTASALALNAAVGGGFTVADGSMLELAILNCTLAGAQTATSGAVPVLVDGAETLVPTVPDGGPESLGLFLEYPEDIKLFGVSFNTTVGDWGVQGEVAYRHDQPLQLDTDQITIAALGASCILDFILGPDAMSAIQGNQTFQGSPNTCGSVPVTGVTDYQGFVREEVITFDIGTTATYTNSNAFVGALGADIGILLTELGAMWVPDAPQDTGATVPGFSRLANVCTSGTDLPLGGFLGLSTRNGCRATEFSYGYVLVGILQYNNAFGTPITLSPRASWSHDVKGNSPAPLSNYREGTKSISLAVDGSYQNTWRGGISYTNIFGNEKYTKDGDKDFVSINLSYSF
eukprot:s1_g553.t1